MPRNPYRLDGPAQICFSGGRTSGYMLWHLLEANGGLPDDCHVTFQNTGKEREETLAFVQECGERWNVPIRWLEWDGFVEGQPQRLCAFREVTFETASRHGEPFERVIDARRIVPNPMVRACTINLKVRTGAAFMLAQGHVDFDAVMGIRADEPQRVARMLNPPKRDTRAGTYVLPLNSARVRKADVLDWWNRQPFNLGLDAQGDLGNCDLCYLKSRRKIVRAIQAEPARAVWWIRQEQRTGHPFRNDRPPYADLLREAQFNARQIPLDFEAGPQDTEDDEALVDCICGD